MSALRWLIFIPVGFLLGSLLSVPIQLLVRLGQWWWGGGYGGMSVFVKSFTLTYFQILCMAWIAPPSLKTENFKIIVSLLFGIYLTVYIVGMSALLNGQPGVDGEHVPAWEVWTSFVSTLIGYIVAVFADKRSIPLLLSDTKGIHPYNSSSTK